MPVDPFATLLDLEDDLARYDIPRSDSQIRAAIGTEVSPDRSSDGLQRGP